jgi:DNA-3-methyladenine glycosylase II
MAALIDRVGPVKLRPRRLPPFQSLTHAVIHQQLSGQAAGTILRRFRALFGDDGFPAPEAVLKASPERLRGAGLSRPKASYILGIAQKAADGYIPTLDDCDRMTDAEIVERLISIKGVGRWTAEMLLIFNLGRADVLPVHDLGVRKGFQHAYRKRKLPDPEQVARYGVRWAPHRTTAAWYLWRAADFLDGDGW